MTTNTGGSIGDGSTIFGESNGGELNGAETTYRREVDPAETTYRREVDGAETIYGRGASGEATEFADPRRFVGQPSSPDGGIAATPFAHQSGGAQTSFFATRNEATAQHSDHRTETESAPPPASAAAAAQSQQQRELVREPETVIAGRYVITEPLPTSGREAESAVGFDRLDPSRRVFIKRYRPERADAKFIAKRVEMRNSLCALDHPNCVRMLTLEPPQGDRPLTEVYEYLDGEQLSITLARSPRPDDAFIRAALEQISAGLDAFQRTVSSVHRDIKPDNIMVIVQDCQPRFVICDYGTATATHIGGVTTFEGTRYYAPPESQSPKQLRDDYLKKFDWWSVGRIIQEMADGRGAWESIKAHVSGARAEDDDAAEAIFYDIVFGHGHDYNVRAGMVEWSNPAWRAPLRGLLTANRRLRWDYEQIRAWLAGENPTDAYDADVDHQRFSFKGKEYEAADAARVLAQAEHWNDAVQQVIERTGIVAYVRKSGNLRVVQELERIFELHRELAPHDPQTADELVVALALAAIGRAKDMPVTICGSVLGAGTIQEYAASNRSQALAALSHPRFLERLAAVSPTQLGQINDLFKRISHIRKCLESFGESRSVLDRCVTKLARYVFVEPAMLRERVDLGRETYATSEITALANALCSADKATADELAAIVYVFESGDRCFRLITRASRERGDVEDVTRISRALRRSFALFFLAPFLLLSEQLSTPLRCAIAGLVSALGWIVYTYSPLTSPDAVARNFAAYWIAAGLLLFICARLLRRSLARFSSNQASTSGTLLDAKECFREAAAVRRAVLAGDERNTLIGLLAKTNRRIRSLQPRHAELRTTRIPIPNAALLPACSILVLLLAVPLGLISGATRMLPEPSDVSADALATRLTTAYISGNIKGAEHYAEGAALAKLRDVAFTHIVQKRLATFGPFRGAREETLATEETFETPGRSLIRLQFARRRLLALLIHSRRRALDFQIEGVTPAR